jgi:Flp pilus assembly CpaF family ATPase
VTTDTPGRLDGIDPGLVADMRSLSRRHHTTAETALKAPEVIGVAGLRAWLARPEITDVVAMARAGGVVTRVRTSTSVTDWHTVTPLAEGAEGIELMARTLARDAGDLRDPVGGVLDVALPEGRMWATFGWGGPAMTASLVVRTHSRGPRYLDDLVRAGTLPADLCSFLTSAVLAGASILVAGPVGAGKTTLLRALCAEIPPGEQLTTIEDTFELGLDRDRDGVMPLLAHPENVEGAGRRSMADLMRHALRSSANRVIVGEVRGPEARYMIRAMATGVAGSLGTIHGRSAFDGLEQLVEYAQEGEGSPPWEQVARRVARAVDLVIYIDAVPVRHVAEVLEVTGFGDAGIQTSSLWRTEDRLPPPTRTGTRLSPKLASRIGINW